MEKIKRHKTRVIRIGKVKIGGDYPVAIQSMTKTDTRDIRSTVKQIHQLEKAGCEIVRVAVPDKKAAEVIRNIKRQIKIPLVADIHFDYWLALLAIENGADKIRINPGNMKNEEELKAVVKAAKKARIPIRIGVNSGSAGESDLVKAALKTVRLFESLDFNDIIISLKSKAVAETVDAYRRMAGACNYPLHLGVTAAGLPETAIVKSSAALGALLIDGIGDTIRISLTGEPVHEVWAAKEILQAVGLRRFGPEIISCPTCGRCQVHLTKIAAELENKLRSTQYAARSTKPCSIAVMGCVVNGPGEARQADIGIAAGKGCGILFKKGKIVKKIKEKDFCKEILRNL